MRKNRAEPYRDIDFSKGKRGAVIAPSPGKTKISIRLDNAVLDHFRAIVEAAGGGNYQTLINDALIAHIQQETVLQAVRRVLREELADAAVDWSKANHARPAARLEDVAGSAGYRGPRRSLAEMERAVAAGVKTRRGRGRSSPASD